MSSAGCTHGVGSIFMFSERVEIKGHIIDSLILPKILDEIMNRNGIFEIEEIVIGQRKEQASYARLKVTAPAQEVLEAILSRLQTMGAAIVDDTDAQWAPAPADGVFPATFYCTTNLPTMVRAARKWVEVENIEMDCGIMFDPKGMKALCLPVSRIKKGDLFITGRNGIRVIPLERARRREVFQFMDSKVSSEKPKALIIREIADEMRAVKEKGQKILVVVGPAVVHTGGGKFLAKIIEGGYVDTLFSGNGFAVHDIEYALYGTSLGIHLDTGREATEGHDHHMRAINKIRSIGGIKRAVETGVLESGVMYSCVKHRVEFVLSASIRDDGPLPDVITDMLEAQDAMREKIGGVGLALMIASTLHSIATGNLLPATVKTFCVDINPAVVTKISDRGTFQILGLVTDSESFLRELAHYLLEP